MESYQVLMNWDGKMEPSSPSSPLSQAPTEEYYVMDDDFANELFGDVMFDVAPEEEKPSAVELLKELAEEVNIKIDKDQWLGVKPKLQLPLMDFVPIPAGPIAVQQPSEKFDTTEELLMEFDYICELTSLTPPQTPPQEQTLQPNLDFFAGAGSFFDEKAQQQQQLDQVPSPTTATTAAWNEENFTYTHSFNEELPSDIRRELEVVDELVRSRSKDLLPNDWASEFCDEDDDDSCSGSSNVSSPPPSDDSSYCGSAYSQDADDDWSPAADDKKRSSLVASGGGVTKKRPRGYGRAPEDKKNRKKEQNKNAATRYRQKKKAEVEEILLEERKLIDYNQELQTKSNDIRREIRYLKSLMRELYKAKGLI